MGILGTIVQMLATFLPPDISNLFHGRAI